MQGLYHQEYGPMVWTAALMTSLKCKSPEARPQVLFFGVGPFLAVLDGFDGIWTALECRLKLKSPSYRQ